LARDRHLKGFPEFEQFCISGFPREHSSFGLSPLRLPFRHARLPLPAIVSDLPIAKQKIRALNPPRRCSAYPRPFSSVASGDEH
jgi:hypothetical protein